MSARTALAIWALATPLVAGCREIGVAPQQEAGDQTDKPIIQIENPDYMNSALFLPKSDQLVLGGGDGPFPGELRFCETTTLKSVLVRKDHKYPIYSLAASPDGEKLATGGGYGEVKVYDATSGKLLAELDAGGAYTYAAAFSHDGRLLANSAGKTLNLWDTKTWEKVASLSDLNNSTYSLAFSPNGSLLAYGQPDAIHFWDVAKRQEAFQLAVEDASHSKLLLTPDGKKVIFGCDGIHRDWSLIHVWDLEKKKEVQVLKGHARYLRGIEVAVIALALDREGKYLISGGGDETVRIWDLASGKELVCLSGNKEIVRAVAVSSGDKYLVACSDELIRVWDLQKLLKDMVKEK